MRRRLALSLALAAVAVLAHGAYLPAKARVAQGLLQHAWTKTLEQGEPNRPWPWADTHPVARLRAPEHDVDLIVLAGATGSSLAFGPGHVAHSGVPGSDDTVVFGGHRDTHFRFLQRLAVGDALEVQAADGRVRRYRVAGAEVTDSSDSVLRLDDDSKTLALVTCYPFDALRAGGTQRYVVSAHGVSL
jgi:sortase A